LSSSFTLRVHLKSEQKHNKSQVCNENYQNQLDSEIGTKEKLTERQAEEWHRDRQAPEHHVPTPTSTCPQSASTRHTVTLPCLAASSH